jgi:hypothetical protein
VKRQNCTKRGKLLEIPFCLGVCDEASVASVPASWPQELVMCYLPNEASEGGPSYPEE